MITTAQDIIEAAYAKSAKNRPGTIANESVELVGLVNRAMQGLYSFAARINPTFFAEEQLLDPTASGWPRPGAAEMVYRIEKTDGAEVKVVPFNDRRIAHPKPAVYAFAQHYRSAGNANDPTSEQLRFFYGRAPNPVANIPDPLDGQWQERFNELLVLEVAIYLGIKDAQAGREAEVAHHKEERDRWAILFASFLEHETVGAMSARGHVQKFNTQSLVPIGSLLAGGSTVNFARAA